EVEAELIGRMTSVFLARVPVHAEVMEIEVALEQPVLPDHPMGVRPDKGLQDRGGVLRMVLARQHVAEVVQEPGDDEFLVPPVAMGARRGLERVDVAVHRLARVAGLEEIEGAQYPIGEPELESLQEREDPVVLLLGAILHAAIARAIIGLEVVWHRLSPEVVSRPSAACRWSCPQARAVGVARRGTARSPGSRRPATRPRARWRPSRSRAADRCRNFRRHRGRAPGSRTPAALPDGRAPAASPAGTGSAGLGPDWGWRSGRSRC